ncbi:class I SAM-dependent methyltransferase [Lentzea albidocapillata]|uniref:Methyltransferase domain-containing protein n=1 Tax=Lentzea albidocapillata TaxID=40571 RepID=A0A1W2ENY3_9PSEU|nr:class I SAM-dependent methyltransferase [Lentzea albidocapillata]SMD11414.1 Methyltransferase domain-containing protein [Lentzea albidocapillata]
MTETQAEQEGELWGRMAAQRAALGAQMSMPAWKTAIERTGITAGTKVLDLACGSGEFCAAATDAGAEATGIDISPSMIALARQASTAEFHELPLGRLPWQDGTFDVVTAFNALFFARDPDEAFAEAVRVSKDYVVVCQWHPEFPSDLLVVGRAVRGTGGRRGAKLPEPQEELTIDIPLVHPDEATMLRSFLSVGSYQRIIENEGEEKVAEKIRAAVEPFQKPDGTYRFSNKYLMSVFRKDQAASIS